MTDQELIWICFEPVVFPYPKILYGSSDPNGDKDIFVPYVPADRIEDLERERDYTEGTNDTLIALNQALTAKLTKAVDALREIEADGPSHGVIKYTLRTVLAELEGK